jgi:hypothetical protein
MPTKSIYDWMCEEKKNASDLWIWKLITKHFAYGLSLPVQLGSFDMLNNLYVLIQEFLDLKNKDSATDQMLKTSLEKIGDQFGTKEKFDNFIKNIFSRWDDLIIEFGNYYEKILEKNLIITTDEIIKEFINGHKELTDNFKKAFCDEDALYYNAFKKLFNHLELKVWKTNGYYTIPLFTAFSYYTPWRWFSLLWYYYELILLQQKNSQEQDWGKWIFPSLTTKKDYYLLPYWQLGYIKRKKAVNNERIFFSCGPVFSPEKIFFDDRATYHFKIRPTLILFRIFQILLDERTNKSFSKSLTPADIFLKTCGTKPYLYLNTVEKHLDKIKAMFDILLNTELDDFKELNKPYRHYLVLTSLLRWALFLSNTLEKKNVEFLRLKFPFNLLDKRYPKTFNLFFKVDILKHIFSIVSEIRNSELVSLKIKTNLEPEGKALFASINNIILAENTPKYYKRLDQDTLNWLDDRLISFNSDVDIRTRTFKQPYLVAAWIRRHFHLQVESDRKEFNENHRPICMRISNLFDADVSLIYSYHHAKQSLILISSWFAEKDEKIYEDELTQRMAELSREDKQKTIAYRAVDLNAVQFTLSYDPNSGKAVPEGQPLFNFEKLPMRSAIAVPLLFKGRLLGILEITGKKSYQFAWTNREVLNQTSSVLSTAFYHQRLVHALHRINTTALNLKDENKLESYSLICQHLSSIFLCDGVSLWFKSEKDRNKYNCLGAYNHEYIQKQLKADSSAVAYTADDRNSLPAKELLQNGKFRTITYEIGKDSLGPEWLKSAPFRRKLKEQGIRYFTAFALKDETGEFGGSISLYDKKKLNYEDWNSMFIFISRFVSVMLEAVRALETERQNIQAKKDHEVTGAAKAALDRLNRFLYLTDQEANLFDNPQQCIDNFQKDKSKASDLKIRLNLVKVDLENQIQKLQYLSKDCRGDEVSKNKLNIEKIEKLSLHKHFNSAWSSIFTEVRKKKLECEIVGAGQTLLLMEKNDLTTILDNLISNAVKYSLPETHIHAIWEKTPGGWRLRMNNWGYSLEPGEEDRIFLNGYRSHYAKKNKINGEGRGLAIVRDTCDKYGIEIYYTYQIIDDTLGQCWHTFTLEFPDVMIRTTA